MKKIRKLIIYLLAVCLVFPAHTRAFAQTPTTEAQVEITAGTGPTYPVNPEDPGTDIDTEPSVTGSLAIVSISDFNFGSIAVTGGGGLYNITTNQPNVQVVDLRGSGSGWSLSASVTGFTSGGSASLPGARIHIYNGRPNSVVSGAYAPAQITDLALTTDNTQAKLISAAAGTGMGLWVMRWYPAAAGTAYIQLDIPAGTATVGTHTATINWTLSDTP